MTADIGKPIAQNWDRQEVPIYHRRRKCALAPTFLLAAHGHRAARAIAHEELAFIASVEEVLVYRHRNMAPLDVISVRAGHAPMRTQGGGLRDVQNHISQAAS